MVPAGARAGRGLLMFIIGKLGLPPSQPHENVGAGVVRFLPLLYSIPRFLGPKIKCQCLRICQ